MTAFLALESYNNRSITSLQQRS